MDVSHILVGALTTVAVAWLVWAEIGSRRNSVEKGEIPVQTALAESNRLPGKLTDSPVRTIPAMSDLTR